MSDRLRAAIRRGFLESGMTEWEPATTDSVYDAVKALAIAETSEHDKALEVLKGTLELAWRTVKREAPLQAMNRRTLAGAIQAVCDDRKDAWNLVERLQQDLGDTREGERAANLEVAHLQRKVDHLQQKLDRPGFQVILEAIRKRAAAAKEQGDNHILWKLDQLHDAAQALLTPDAASPQVSIIFSFDNVENRLFFPHAPPSRSEFFEGAKPLRPKP